MFRSLRTWMLMALPVAGLLLAPLTADAASRKRVRNVRRGVVVTPYGTYRNSPDGPPVYNTLRALYRVPPTNPIPPFGYYGGQQYYSQWVPTGFYNFR